MGIPKPHQTPSINLGGHGKSWQNLTSEQLLPGDLLKGQGAVVCVHETNEAGHAPYYTVTMMSGTTIYALNDSVHEVFGPTR